MNKYTWDEAQKVVDELNTAAYLSHNDWRLPEIEELISLLDFSKANPACKLPDTVPSRYWSATPCAGYDSYAWCVNFYYGYVYDNSKAYSYYVRAVRTSEDALEWGKTL